jgi:hypothetical protein
MEPTIEQLRTFYQIVRQAVLLSSYISFVELAQDQNLYVYTKRYDAPLSSLIILVTPNGQFRNLMT